MHKTSFAVRSEATTHRGLTRRPYEHVHRVKASFLDSATMRALADAAYNWAPVDQAGEIDTAFALESRMPACVPLESIKEKIAGTIRTVAVVGTDGARVAQNVLAKADPEFSFLTCMGAPFHNDVMCNWPSCLFWCLALDVFDVEFVMPHLGVRLLLEPGDLIVFDPCFPHGVCRPRDGGCFVPAHFEEDSAHHSQAFLSGELQLDEAQWEALGCAWQPDAEAPFRAATDLLTAEFNPHTGVVV